MKKTVGEIVKAIIDHGHKIYLAAAYPAILRIEMSRGGYKESDPEYDKVILEVSQAVNAYRRMTRERAS